MQIVHSHNSTAARGLKPGRFHANVEGIDEWAKETAPLHRYRRMDTVAGKFVDGQGVLRVDE